MTSTSHSSAVAAVPVYHPTQAAAVSLFELSAGSCDR